MTRGDVVENAQSGVRTVRIPLEGAYNFRDLGGYTTRHGPIRSGILFRSDALNAITVRDREELRRREIGALLDLREDVERSTNPDAIGDLPIEMWHVPLHDNVFFRSDGAASLSLEDQYRAYAGPYRHRVVEAVRRVIGAKEPVVIHCTAGKDRTGVVIAILLDLLGVERDVVEADYLASTRFLDRGGFWERVADDYTSAGLATSALAESKQPVQGSIVTKVLEMLSETHGSVEAFLRENGLGTAAIDGFRSRLIG